MLKAVEVKNTKENHKSEKAYKPAIFMQIVTNKTKTSLRMIHVKRIL